MHVTHTDYTVQDGIGQVVSFGVNNTIKLPAHPRMGQEVRVTAIGGIATIDGNGNLVKLVDFVAEDSSHLYIFTSNSGEPCGGSPGVWISNPSRPACKEFFTLWTGDGANDNQGSFGGATGGGIGSSSFGNFTFTYTEINVNLTETGVGFTGTQTAVYDAACGGGTLVQEYVGFFSFLGNLGAFYQTNTFKTAACTGRFAGATGTSHQTGNAPWKAGGGPLGGFTFDGVDQGQICTPTKIPISPPVGP